MQLQRIKVKLILYIKINNIFILIGDISDCTLSVEPSLFNTEQLIIPDANNNNLETDLSKEGLLVSGVESIDSYQTFLRQIAYVSRSPVRYLDRSFTLSCAGADDQTYTNEIRVRVRFYY